MTRILLTISILLFSILTFSQTGKMNSYELNIKKGKTVKENNQTFWIIPVRFANNSLDTLRYFSMSCSWQDFYSVDNKKLQIETALCDKNIPIILIIAPGQTKTVEIRLLISPTIVDSKIKFRIGFNLMEASNSQKPLDFDFIEEQKKKNLIWSNEISM
jgi:hypothetical protein